MITASITRGERVALALRGLADRLPRQVEQTVTAFALDVSAAAKRNAPVKHGRLRRSIHHEITVRPGYVSGIVGTDVEYAGLIERGFKGTMSVRAFVRKQTQAWGRPIAARMVPVRGHSRNVERPARPFLAPALEGVTPPLADRLRADVRRLTEGLR